MDHLKLPRSQEWPKLRNKWLADHPTCAACGKRKNLQVHHKIPVHVSRSMELDPTNLITLCENETTAKDASGRTLDHCHLLVGHLGNWYAYNKNVDQQAHKMLLLTYPKLQHNGTMLVVAPEATTPRIVAADPAASPDSGTLETSPLNRVKRIKRRQ